MPKKRIFDGTALIKAIESGTPSTQIRQEFDINTSAQLKLAYLDALIEKGKIVGITSGRSGKAKAEKKQVKVNKRGSVVIPRPMVEELGFSIGENFSVQKTEAGVSLKKV